MIKKLAKLKRGLSQLGQASIEYILVLSLTALFGMFLTRYFIDTFSEGMDLLSKNIGVRLETGQGFSP